MDLDAGLDPFKKIPFSPQSHRDAEFKVKLS